MLLSIMWGGTPALRSDSLGARRLGEVVGQPPEEDA